MFPSAGTVGAAAAAAGVRRAGGHAAQGHAQHQRQPDPRHAAAYLQL